MSFSNEIILFYVNVRALHLSTISFKLTSCLGGQALVLSGRFYSDLQIPRMPKHIKTHPLFTPTLPGGQGRMWYFATCVRGGISARCQLKWLWWELNGVVFEMASNCCNSNCAAQIHKTNGKTYFRKKNRYIRMKSPSLNTFVMLPSVIESFCCALNWRKHVLVLCVYTTQKVLNWQANTFVCEITSYINFSNQIKELLQNKMHFPDKTGLKSQPLKLNIQYYGLRITNSAAWSLPNSSCPNCRGVRFTVCSPPGLAHIWHEWYMLIDSSAKAGILTAPLLGLVIFSRTHFDPDLTSLTSWQDVCSLLFPHWRWHWRTFAQARTLARAANISWPCATECCQLLCAPLKSGTLARYGRLAAKWVNNVSRD